MVSGCDLLYRRAVKCYQKAVAIKPDLVEAGMGLAHVLATLGDEVMGVAII